MLKMYISTLSLFLIGSSSLVSCVVNGGENWGDKCIIRGTCGPNPSGSRDMFGNTNCLNCKLETPERAKKLADKEAIDLMYSACPHLRTEFEQDPAQNAANPRVCCTKRQVQIMESSFGQANDLMGRCPTCYANWRKNFCATTCLPGNYEFLKIATEQEEENGKNVTKEMIINAPQAACGGDASGSFTEADPGMIFCTIPK